MKSPAEVAAIHREEQRLAHDEALNRETLAHLAAGGEVVERLPIHEGFIATMAAVADSKSGIRPCPHIRFAQAPSFWSPKRADELLCEQCFDVRVQQPGTCDACQGTNGVTEHEVLLAVRGGTWPAWRLRIMLCHDCGGAT